MIRLNLTGHGWQHAACIEALAGATGGGSALRHRSAIRHRVVAGTIGSVVSGHFRGHGARLSHRHADNRREPQGQRDEQGQQCSNPKHDGHSSIRVPILLRAIAGLINRRGGFPPGQGEQKSECPKYEPRRQ